MRSALLKPSRWLLLVTVLALFAAACGGGDDGAEPGAETPAATDEDTGATTPEGEQAAGGEFSLYQCEPKFLGPPQRVTESCGSQVLEGLYSNLVVFDENLNPLWGDEAPDAAAADIQGSDDATVWTVTIKEGWTFHNGEPVTAQDYVNAWNWGAYGPNAADGNYFFTDIEGYDALNPTEEGAEPEATELSGLRVIDETTFEVTLAEPFRQYPLKLAYNVFNPVPPEGIEDPEAFNEQPIGNGPYQMAGPWEHDVQIQLERYEDYPGTPGNADQITVRIYADINTAYNELLAGNLDFLETLPPERVDEARSQYADRIVTAPSSYFGFIGMPTYVEPFDNPDIRKALSMAIDRQAIIDTILKNGQPADDMVAPLINGYREGACGEACEFDPEGARELFEQAGGIDGTLDIWFNSGAGHEPVYEAVANMWRQNLGISDIRFQALPFAEILTAFENEEVTGPYRLAWIMDYPSMQNYIGNLLGCGGSANYTGYCNEEADELVVQGNGAETIEEATQLYQQADDMFLADLPIIPFYYREAQGIRSENISNANFTEREHLNLSEVTVNQ